MGALTFANGDVRIAGSGNTIWVDGVEVLTSVDGDVLTNAVAANTAAIASAVGGGTEDTHVFSVTTVKNFYLLPPVVGNLGERHKYIVTVQADYSVGSAQHTITLTSAGDAVGTIRSETAAVPPLVGFDSFGAGHTQVQLSDGGIGVASLNGAKGTYIECVCVEYPSSSGVYKWSFSGMNYCSGIPVTIPAIII